jgi:hypothetical protein
MALVKGTNSYVTVAEADTYFGDRLNASVWDLADDTTKAQALITATRLLDDMSWSGTAISESQALSFPRSGSYFDPKVGGVISFGSSTPSRVSTANYELALHLMSNEDATSAGGSVKSIKVGDISLDNINQVSTFPYAIKKIINPLLDNGGSNMWWRAN